MYRVGFFLVLTASVPFEVNAHTVQASILGEVIRVSSDRNFDTPPNFEIGAPVQLLFDFEAFTLSTPDYFSDPVLILSGEAVNVTGGGSAKSEIVSISDGLIVVGGQELGRMEGTLFVADDKVNGFCAAYGCSLWNEDAIQLRFHGNAGAEHNGANFGITGGFLSQSASEAEPSDTLEIGSQLGDSATWNGFDGGTLYLRLRSESGERLSSITVRLNSTTILPEPSSIAVAWLAIATLSMSHRISRRAVKRTALQ